MPILPYHGVWPTIAQDAFIASTATIAGDVTIASGASVWFGAVIRAESAPVQIGARSNVQDNCTIHTDDNAPVVIGKDCSLGHNAVVHGAVLGDRVLIGMHAIVLNNAFVASDCIVAAGAIVTEGKQIEPGQLVMDMPGKPVRPLTGAERERILTGARHYQQFAADYRAALATPPTPEAGGDEPSSSASS